MLERDAENSYLAGDAMEAGPLDDRRADNGFISAAISRSDSDELACRFILTQLFPVDDQRTDAIARSILGRRPEIVALCEVWADARATRVTRALERDYPYHFRPESRPGFVLSSGLLLLSRLPIRHAEFTPYRDSVEHQSADNGFISAEILRSDADELACRFILTSS